MLNKQTDYSLGSILAAALLAGVAAGLFVAAFHHLATEPVLQRAIDLEAAMKKASGQPVGPELFSRFTQNVGLFIGYLFYGIGWGALFGVVACLLPLLTRTAFSMKQGLGLVLRKLLDGRHLPTIEVSCQPTWRGHGCNYWLSTGGLSDYAAAFDSGNLTCCHCLSSLGES